MTAMLMWGPGSKKTQHVRGWTAADICTNCVHTNPAPRNGGPIPFFSASRQSFPAAWLCPSQKRGTSSQIVARQHTTPVIWMYDPCHKPINKQQTSIRCNHTHWVHLKCTQIKQRQYKPDWRCTIQTPTQLAAQSTSNTYINNQQYNKVTNTIPLTVHHSITTLTRANRRTLAQLRTNKCPLLLSYLNKIDKDPSPLWPFEIHLFNCTNIITHLKVTELWAVPVEEGWGRQNI